MNEELDALLRRFFLDPSKLGDLSPEAEYLLLLGLRAALGVKGLAVRQAPAVASLAAAWSPGDMLTLDEAATLMNVSPRWLRRNWRVVGFARRLNRGEIWFSRAGAACWRPAGRANHR